MIIIHNSYYFFLQVRPPIIHGFSIQGSCSHIIIGFVSFSSTKRSMRWREYSNISNPRLKKNELGKKIPTCVLPSASKCRHATFGSYNATKSTKKCNLGEKCQHCMSQNLKSAFFELANKNKGACK